MFVYLSKFIPQLIYPIGLASVLLLFGLVAWRKRKAAFWFILIAFSVLWLGGNRWVAFGLARSLEWQYFPPAEIPQADVIVVLGGGTESMSYPRMSAEINGAGDRVLTAARLFKNGNANYLLLSGGNITWLDSRPSTPAEEMADILKLVGIPDENLWLQTKSQNTYEDALYSSEMLREKQVKTVLLVTSAQHMPRSVALFNKQGISVIPVPTDYIVTEYSWNDLWKAEFGAQLINIFPSAGNLSITTACLKEYIGIMMYRFQGWL